MAKKTRITRRRVQLNVPKKCFFCEEKKDPNFSDVASLQKFVTERGKITGRSRNGFCSKHQRKLTIAIKHARHLALMPFVGK
ncbi:MAG: 30S ribosomal protein S18 [Patescibacteria group bacterium]|nr:30S ribosomal protein S18 [Patescibacteria group bacterium]